MAIIGIDLGTTNSLACAFKNGKAELIPNKFGKYLTPSVISVDGEIIHVGQIAKDRLISQPYASKASFKRFMGSDTTLTLSDKTFTAPELSAFVIKELVNDAKTYLCEDITEAIISVPAYFNDDMRRATKNAGLIAGVNVERVINEPSAAALATRRGKENEDCTLLVLDLGGGTFDVSVVECFENVVSVLSVSGDNHLGGDDFDEKIAEHFCFTLGVNFKDLRLDDKEILLSLANKAKQVLTHKEAVFGANLQTANLQGYLTLRYNEFIKICNSLFTRLKTPILKAMQDANIKFADLDDIVLVGGGCKIFAVQQFFAFITSRQITCNNESDLLVAKGVGIYAGIKSRNEDVKQLILTDICPFSLGVAIHNHQNPEMPYFSPIIERNTTLPVSKSHSYIPVQDGQKEILFRIYQGESMLAKENTELASININLTPGEKEPVDVRFTYDINGILQVEIDAQGNTHSHVIVNNNNLTSEKLESILSTFEQYKTPSEEEQEVAYIYALANAAYTQSTGVHKEIILDMLKSVLNQIESTNSKVKKSKIIKDFYNYLQDKFIFNNFDEFAWNDYSDTETDNEDTIDDNLNDEFNG